jgi:hypothetical protein
MALGTNPHSGITLVAMIPERWSPMVLEEMFAATCAANFFTDLSEYVADGGDIIHVPDVYTNMFTVQTQSTQGTEITLGNPTQVDVTLSTWLHKYVAQQIGSKELAQLDKSYDFNAIYTRKMGGVLADALEDSLFALWSGLSTNSVGDTATILNDAEIRQSIEKLATANFDLKECAWFLHPYVFWVQLGSIAKYYDLSISGRTFLMDGNFGKMDESRGLKGSIYGIPAFVTSNVVSGLQTYRNLLAHKTAFGFAIQTPANGKSYSNGKVNIMSEYVIEFLSNVTVAEILYTVGELRDAAGVVVNASSAFIGS